MRPSLRDSSSTSRAFISLDSSLVWARSSHPWHLEPESASYVTQNAVPQSELGVATSSATFFRSIGGSFGTAIFGAIYANVLVGNLHRHLAKFGSLSLNVPSTLTPSALRAVSPAIRDGVTSAIGQSLNTVFLVSVPIAAVAFILTWWLPAQKLRGAQDEAAADTRPSALSLEEGAA
jgi:hypothetical protein